MNQQLDWIRIALSNQWLLCRIWRKWVRPLSAQFINHPVNCLQCSTRFCYYQMDEQHLWGRPKKPQTFFPSLKTIFLFFLLNKYFFFFLYSFGYTCPRSYNPADFLISIFASTPGHEKHANRTSQHLCDSFIVSKASQERDLLVNLELHMAESSEVI